jgi:hypothetical protein
MSGPAKASLPREFRDDEQLVRVLAVLEAHVGVGPEDVRMGDQSAMAAFLAWLSTCHLPQHSGVAPS